MLCKLHIIWPHESLEPKNSCSQRTPRIGGAQLTCARTPTTMPSPLLGSPDWQGHTHPPSVGSHCLRLLYQGTDLTQLAKAPGLEASPRAECLEEPRGGCQGCGSSLRTLPQTCPCLECPWETPWEASGSTLQMGTPRPSSIEGSMGRGTRPHTYLALTWLLSGGGQEGH